ncbi:hypothetical protein [Actinoplanes sp. URMC 104]|uniref:hypothetical protein n=1 Tax=Actinoplanes sp. URMC 104 TaxID=3423409 RepID=UPI003F1C10FE
MTRMYLTFVGDTDLNASATAVGRALGLEFTERESLFLGGDYFLARPPWGEVIVQHNDDQGEPAEPAYPDAPTVITVTTDAGQEPHVLAALRDSGFTQVVT